ncbi:MAG: hypothetical protein KGR25_12430 [Chloroflexi bacterium]|nr:hypothetical protein [Chloroflexota bacterium]
MDPFVTLSDDLLFHILSSIYTPNLCYPNTLCAGLVRLVAKRWKKIIALRMPVCSRVTMSVSESWYLGNQPSIELLGIHPFRCRGSEVVCQRVRNDRQSPVATTVNGPVSTIEHRGYPIRLSGPQVTYIGAIPLVAFDTGRRLVHVNPYMATEFKCERDRPSVDDLTNLQSAIIGIFPGGPTSSRTCLASRVDAQMSDKSILSFMDRGSQSGAQSGTIRQ